MYCYHMKNINRLRFQKFSLKCEQEEKYVHLAILAPCRNSRLLHTQQANCTPNLMKSANTAIVQEPPLQDCGGNVSGNIIWTNEHFPE